MDGAHLAEEAASDELAHAVDLHECTPEAMCRGSIIRSMRMVFRKADRIRHLARQLVEGNRDADGAQELDNARVELGNRLWLERKRPLLTLTGAGEQAVTDKIKLNLKNFVPERDGRCPKAARRHV